jgi:hypothetical protein
MNRQDFNGKTPQELEQMFEGELKTYKETIDAMMTLEELMDAEQKLMEEAQEYDKYLDTVEYPLVDKIEFDGSNYSRNDLAKIIMSAISKMEVEWANTLGLYEMYNIWKNKDMASVAYKVFDSTLRILNQVKYKGPQEWKDMLAVNKFLAECHADYTLDTNFNVLISKKHNCILERYELVQKENNVVDEATVVQQGV